MEGGMLEVEDVADGDEAYYRRGVFSMTDARGRVVMNCPLHELSFSFDAVVPGGWLLALACGRVASALRFASGNPEFTNRAGAGLARFRVSTLR